MWGKKIRRGLAAGIVSLSLLFGQGIVCAADQIVSVDVGISQAVPYGMYFITGNGVRVRASASTSGTILGVLYKDNNDIISITNISSDGNWVYGGTSIGISGWVSISYVDIAGGPID